MVFVFKWVWLGLLLNRIICWDCYKYSAPLCTVLAFTVQWWIKYSTSPKHRDTISAFLSSLYPGLQSSQSTVRKVWFVQSFHAPCILEKFSICHSLVIYFKKSKHREKIVLCSAQNGWGKYKYLLALFSPRPYLSESIIHHKYSCTKIKFRRGWSSLNTSK